MTIATNHIDNNGTIWAEVRGGIMLDIGIAKCCARDLHQCSTCGTRTNHNEDRCAWCINEDAAEVIERDDNTPQWVSVLVRPRSGAVWCTECDAPFVSCGSLVHNPNHTAGNPFRAEAQR